MRRHEKARREGQEGRTEGREGGSEGGREERAPPYCEERLKHVVDLDRREHRRVPQHHCPLRNGLRPGAECEMRGATREV